MMKKILLRFIAVFLLVGIFTALQACRFSYGQDEKTDNSRANTGSLSENDDEDSVLTVRFIDVGQGDSVLLTCDHHSMLIDGGPSSASNVLYTILKREEISYLDFVVATHGDADHVGGLSGALEYAKPGKVYCTEKDRDTKTFRSFKERVEAQECEIEIPASGDSFSLGSARVEILAPIGKTITNNSSVVLKVTHCGHTFLFTGDSEMEDESILAEQYGEMLKSDVLKVSHHGSAYSTSYKFLYYVNPEYAVISCGKKNSYGHPHEETLSRLRDADVSLFRTDLQGDIIFTSSKNGLDISVQKNKDINSYQK